MIDVFLVLLIIFMVISPNLSVGLGSQIPQAGPEVVRSESQSIDEAIVISIKDDLSIQINQEPIPVHEFQDRLRVVLKSRTDRSVFVQADSDLPFEAVAATIDGARTAGADRIGLLTDKLRPANPQAKL
jgi:biopolymer transport protein ExbD